MKPLEHKLNKEQLDSLKYVNIHCHTTYSLLDGVGNLKDHIEGSYKKGHQGCSISDHGVMGGVLDLYFDARDERFLKKINYPGKVFPHILGVELYILDDTRIRDKKAKYHHITLFAKNETGYRNLCKLTSMGTQEKNFFTRPRVSLRDLFKYKEGIIATSGCFIGYIPQAIFQDKGLKKSFLKEQLKKETYQTYIEKLEHPFGKAFDYFQASKKNRDFLKKILKDEHTREAIELAQKIPLETQVLDLIESSSLKPNEQNELKSILAEHQPEDLLLKFKEEFGADFYIEVHLANLCMRWNNNTKVHEDQGWNPQEKVNRELIRLLKKHKMKGIICQDSHMPKKEHHILQSIMIWNSPSGSGGWHFPDSYHIMTVEEMYHKFVKNYPWMSDEEFIEWTENSMEVLEKCKDLKLNQDKKFIQFKTETHYLNRKPYYVNKKILKNLEKHNKNNYENIKKIYKSIENHPEIIDSNKSEKFFKKIESIDIKLNDYIKENSPLSAFIKELQPDSKLLLLIKSIVLKEKLFPRKVKKEELKTVIKKQYPDKSLKNFRGKTLQKIIDKYYLYEKERDHKLIFGSEEYQERLVYELNFFKENEKLIDYILLLDEISFLIHLYDKQKSFGRGSACSSLLCFALDITNIDPVKYQLNFDRFLSNERMDLPDIDFETNDRQFIVDYLVDQYGRNHVAEMGVYEHIELKQCVKDVLFHQFKVNKNDISEILKQIDLVRKEKGDISLQKMIKYNKELKYFFEDVPALDLIQQLERNYRRVYKDPTALILCENDIIEETPCQEIKESKLWMTMSQSKQLEKIGLIQYDFLPDPKLKIIQSVLKNKNFHLRQIPLNDALVLDNFKKANLLSIFDFDTALFRKVIKNKNIDSIEDLSALWVLSHPHYQNIVKMKLFKNISEKTYGYIIYQEQVMEILKQLGFSLKEQFYLIKPKRFPLSVYEQLEDKFFTAMEKKKYDINDIKKLWEHILYLKRFSFNKAHALALTQNHYVCMWFKTYFSSTWMAAVLDTYPKEFKHYYEAWKKYMKHPHINKSQNYFKVDKKKVYIPFQNIYKMSSPNIAKIIEKQPYESFKDFMNKHPKMSKAQIKNLILVGCFDSFSEIPFDLDYRKECLKSIGFNEYKNHSKDDFLMEEFTLLGIPSFDYMSLYNDKMLAKSKKLFKMSISSLSQIHLMEKHDVLVVGGAVEKIQYQTVSKGHNKGKDMAKIHLINDGVRTLVTVFSDELALDKKMDGFLENLKIHDIIIVKGKIGEFNNENVLNYIKGAKIDV